METDRGGNSYGCLLGGSHQPSGNLEGCFGDLYLRWDIAGAQYLGLGRSTPIQGKVSRSAISEDLKKKIMGSRDRLRVAMISTNFGEYCIRLANAVSRYADVLLAVPDQLVAAHRQKLDAGVRLFSFRSPRYRQPFRQLQTIRRVFQEIERFGPHVVHYQGFHPWFDLALPFWRRYPLVCTVHDFRAHPGDKLSQKTPFWVEMFVRRRSDQLIVHSQHVRSLMVEQLGGADQNISLIPHIQIGQDVALPAVDEDEHLILFFGRIWGYKGLEYLI